MPSKPQSPAKPSLGSLTLAEFELSVPVTGEQLAVPRPFDRHQPSGNRHSTPHCKMAESTQSRHLAACTVQGSCESPISAIRQQLETIEVSALF